MNYQKSSLSSHLLLAHIIFVTKYREKKLTHEHLGKIEEMIRYECLALKARCLEINGEADHIHMIVQYPPSLSISKLVQRLKSVSSRKLKLHFPELNQVTWRRNALWSSGYFACSVGGAPISVLKQYIQQQDRPD